MQTNCLVVTLASETQVLAAHLKRDFWPTGILSSKRNKRREGRNPARSSRQYKMGE
jgi:hypothetical protein